MAKIRDGVDVGWQNFENLLGIGLDLGCIFQMGWTWGGRGGQRGGLGHPVSHPVHPGHPIGDIYNTNSPNCPKSTGVNLSQVNKCVILIYHTSSSNFIGNTRKFK